MNNEPTTRPQRLQSLDALRGFDMFWIMGGEKIFVVLASLTSIPFFKWWGEQMHHVKWHGFAAYDMIFPLFLFIAGISFPFSMAGRLAKGDRKGLYRHVVKRGVILVLLGIIYNNGINFNFEELRYASVLGRIGLAGMFAALIFMNTKLRGQIIWLIGILLAYWAMFEFFTAPDLGSTDHYSMQGNIASYIDRLLLPGEMCCYKLGDNEGILSTLPAIGTALLGMLTGKFLINRQFRPTQKVLYMAIMSVNLMLIGKIWEMAMPINKNLWTSSFVCWVGGLSLLLFTIFYYIIDVLKLKKWAFPFVVIGVNPITIYLAERIIGFKNATDFFFGSSAKYFSENGAALFLAVGFVIVGWAFLYLLYKKKIFLKV